MPHAAVLEEVATIVGEVFLLWPLCKEDSDGLVHREADEVLPLAAAAVVVVLAVGAEVGVVGLDDGDGKLASGDRDS